VSDGSRARARLATTTDQQRELRNAIEAGPLAHMPGADVTRFLAAGIPVDLPQRAVYLREGDGVRPALITSGLLRATLLAPDGRQVTVSYMRPGDVIGIFGIFGGPFSAAIETVGPASLLAFVPEVVADLVERDPGKLHLFARVVTRRLYVVVEELTLHLFGTVRERVCHHLLDLAMSADGTEGPLVAVVTQQDLADATGTARESVARALRDLESEGLIERTGKRVVLLEPLLLHPAHEHWQEHRMPIA
jgi:CRP/FNR family transcriptional regulator